MASTKGKKSSSTKTKTSKASAAGEDIAEKPSKTAVAPRTTSSTTATTTKTTSTTSTTKTTSALQSSSAAEKHIPLDSRFQTILNQASFAGVQGDPRYEIEKELIIVAPDKRRTSDKITRAELSRAISTRARQIQEGGQIFVESTASDPSQIAVDEILAKKSPVAFARQLAENLFEIWEVNEMIVEL